MAEHEMAEHINTNNILALVVDVIGVTQWSGVHALHYLPTESDDRC